MSRLLLIHEKGFNKKPYLKRMLMEMFRRIGEPMTSFMQMEIDEFENLEPGEREFFKEQINCILVFGSNAFLKLTNKSPLDKYRGAVIDSPYGKVIGTYSPAWLLKGNTSYSPIVELDIRKAINESKHKEIKYPERKIEIIETESRAIEVFEWLIKEFDGKPVAVDIETAGKLMTAYGVAVNKKEAYVWNKEVLRLPQVLKAMDRFNRSGAKKIFHNALYDMMFLAYYYRSPVLNFFRDTMLMQHICFPTFLKSLGFCASVYTNEPYWKDEGKDFFKEIKKGVFKDWTQLYIYNAKDCCLTYEIWEKLEDTVKEFEVEEANEMVQAFVEPALAMQLQGLEIDKDEYERQINKFEMGIKKYEYVARKLLGETFKVRSSKQMKQLLYEDWGLKPIIRNGRITTDAKALKELSRSPSKYQAILGFLADYKSYLKHKDYLKVTLDEDGKERFSLKLAGTISGRLSSAKSITGSGKNFQNIPKEMRFYKAPDGYMFVQMDLSQVEARMVAAYAKDYEWLRQYDEIDVHSWVATQLFHIPMEKVSKSYHRQIAKKVSHASNYMMGWHTLAITLDVDAKEAKRLLAQYYASRKKLKPWQMKIEDEVRSKRVLRSPFGRIIQFYGTIDNSALRTAVSWKPQSAASDYMLSAINRMYQCKEFDNCYFIIPVHDSILVAVPDNYNKIKRVIKKMRELTEVPVDLEGLEIVIPVDFEIGYVWNRLKEVKDIDNFMSLYKKLKEEIK